MSHFRTNVPTLSAKIAVRSNSNKCTKSYNILFVKTPRKFITANLSFRSVSPDLHHAVLIICDLFNSHALFIYQSVVICWLASFEI